MAPECEETLVSYCMYINIFTYAYPPRVRGTAGRICNQDVTSELNVNLLSFVTSYNGFARTKF